MDLGEAIELRGDTACGVTGLYVLLSNPVWFLTLFRILISLFLMVLVGSLVEQTIGFIYVILSIHYYHSYPFICSKDYAVPVPFKFP